MVTDYEWLSWVPDHLEDPDITPETVTPAQQCGPFGHNESDAVPAALNIYPEVVVAKGTTTDPTPDPAAGDLVVVVIGYRGVGSTLTPPAGQGWQLLGTKVNDGYPGSRLTTAVYAAPYDPAWAASSWTFTGAAVGTRCQWMVSITKNVDPDLLANPGTYLTFSTPAPVAGQPAVSPATVPTPARLRQLSNVHVYGITLDTANIDSAWWGHVTPATYAAPIDSTKPRSAAGVRDLTNAPASFTTPLPLWQRTRAATTDPNRAHTFAVLILPSRLTGGEPGTDPVFVPGAWALDEDRTAGLISWTITYGRQDYTARVNPLTATVGLAGHYAAPCPPAGARFRLRLADALADALGLTDAERVRFTGEITDPVIDPRNPVSDVYTITGAGRLGRYRRRTVDGHTWPQQKDGARVARILEAAGADDEAAGTIDVGVRPLIPPVRKVTAGQLLDQTSDSTGGQLVEQLDGVLDWHSAEHRRGVPATVTLDAGEILNDLTFEQHVGDLVNRLELSYGRDDATVVVRDPASIDDRDVYESSLSTALANAIDAHDLGLEIVGRRSEPVWQLPNLVVDLRRAITSPAKRAQLLALRFGDRITVTGLPAGAPYPGAVELYVEGITETATPRAWRLSIAVSDPLLSGVGVRWLDVDPALTWAGVAPALTWLDLARIEDPTELEA